MKKIALIGSMIVSFLAPARAFAEDIIIKEPEAGFKNIGDFVNNVITLAFVFAVLVVLVMLIMGAYEWMVSGGDKEAVSKARNRIINALIGLVVLAVAFALARLAATFVGFDLLKIQIPEPPK